VDRRRTQWLLDTKFLQQALSRPQAPLCLIDGAAPLDELLFLMWRLLPVAVRSAVYSRSATASVFSTSLTFACACYSNCVHSEACAHKYSFQNKKQ
jgi:hypothetical protein